MKQVVIPTVTQITQVTQITHSPVKSVSSKQVRLTHPVLNTLNTHFDLSNPFMEDMPLFVPPLDIPLDKAISGVDQPNISHMMISDHIVAIRNRTDAYQSIVRQTKKQKKRPRLIQ